MVVLYIAYYFARTIFKLFYMDWQEYIESKPNILFGKPAIKGTRIGVDLVIEKLSLGETMEDLLGAYPHIELKQIFACLAYAAAMIRHEEIYYLNAG